MNALTQSSAGYVVRHGIGLLLIALLVVPPAAVAGYRQHNLVTDNQQNLVNSGYTPADQVDPYLKNPWGISSSSTGPFWVSDADTGLSTIYNGAGVPSSLVVSVPGGPTGQIFNGGSNFQVSSGSPARFIFATEAGTISGWSPAANQTNAIGAVDNSASGASYKGLAIDSSSSGSLLFAADFGNGKIDVFNSIFAPTVLAGLFSNPNLPANYVPFNIQNLGGELYVAYAFKANPNDPDETAGAGLGIVDVFDTKGNFIKQLIGAGGALNAPWGLAMAPSDFGEFSNSLLVGNFGDGKINVFDPVNGSFMGTLSDVNGSPIVIDGLWGLSFGNGANAGSKETLYFTAGINDEEHGLFGSLSSVSEPASLPMVILGLALILGCFRTREPLW